MLLEDVIDPTGAGDSFAGGFFGYLASQPEQSPVAYRRAMFYGSVMVRLRASASARNGCRSYARGD